MSFFYKSEKKNSAKSILELDRIVYAIDTSGSTAGTILQEEVFSAKTFFALLSQEKKNFTILTWNSYCNAPASLDQIVHSGGGTEPSCIIPQVIDHNY